MKQVLGLIGLGILLWLMVFAGAMMLFMIRTEEPIFFETLISIVLAFSTVVVTIIYFYNVKKNFVLAGARAGIVWMLMSLAIDMPLFSSGPMHMEMIAYMKDIGITYVMIPVITVGMGIALARRR